MKTSGDVYSTVESLSSACRNYPHNSNDGRGGEKREGMQSRIRKVVG
jgi:hypothetical protein